MPEDALEARAAESNKRRSHRLLLPIPLRVRWISPNNEACVENVTTMVVNAHGGLFALAGSVLLGQELRLTHRQTEEEIVCRVVFVGQKQDGKTQVGFEFSEPFPKFWGVAFPPGDWYA